MKRTIAPEQRRRFLQENITLNIKEENDTLKVVILLHNIHQQNYSDNAKIILEAYNRINIKRLELGEVKDYKEEERSHRLPFDIPVRAKINFRLKIIDPDTFKILGYAENLKEEKYAKSLLEINSDDENVKNIYRIDFDNPEHPIFYLNPELAQYAENLKPIIAEMSLKDILNYLLFQANKENYFQDHKWFKFAEKISQYDKDESERDECYGLTWINKVLCKFSEDKQLIKLITKKFKAND